MSAIDRPVNDSGERRDFDTGAQRDQVTGKGRYDLLPVLALPRIAAIFEKGAKKYEARNWEKGMPLGVYMDSAMRHLTQYVAGKADEDHLGQAAWNLLAAMQTEEMIEMGLLPSDLDDLPHYHTQAGLTEGPAPELAGEITTDEMRRRAVLSSPFDVIFCLDFNGDRTEHRKESITEGAKQMTFNELPTLRQQDAVLVWGVRARRDGEGNEAVILKDRHGPTTV